MITTIHELENEYDSRMTDLLQMTPEDQDIHLQEILDWFDEEYARIMERNAI